MTPAKLTEYKKAIGGALGALLGIIGLVLSHTQLHGAAKADLSNILTVGTPILGFLGTAIAPKNAQTATVVSSSEDLIAGLKKILTDAETIKAAVAPKSTTIIATTPTPPVPETAA